MSAKIERIKADEDKVHHVTNGRVTNIPLIITEEKNRLDIKEADIKPMHTAKEIQEHRALQRVLNSIVRNKSLTPAKVASTSSKSKSATGTPVIHNSAKMREHDSRANTSGKSTILQHEKFTL